MHSAQELVSQIEALTSLPDVYDRVRAQLESPTGSAAEVARLVAADPALTARLLRLVNSAMFGHRARIDSVDRAVQLLGLQQVHDLVLAMSLHAVFAGVCPAQLDMRRFWRNSVLNGLASRAAARQAQMPSSERLFVIGLLADVGHLVLYQTVPELAAEALAAASHGDETLDAAERRIVGCDFAEIGAALADRWQLPPCFAGAIGTQLRPRLGGEFSVDAAVLSLSRCIVGAEAANRASAEAAAQIDAGTWELLGLAPEQLAGIREEAELNLAAYLALFFPTTARPARTPPKPA
ncbi:HDOD domain-containing protein [Thauera sp. WH-1]|uniref:HDOD domain-containing protein n=1 Tax=Thauera sp. WH-1 TaxID=3398230 RepID=UPI0039FCC844